MVILKTALTRPRKLPAWFPYFSVRCLTLIAFTLLILVLRSRLIGLIIKPLTLNRLVTNFLLSFFVWLRFNSVDDDLMNGCL